MARKPNTYIELDGPLFDPRMVKLFRDAVAEGIEEIGEGPGVELTASAIAQGGFIRTGAFVRSVESQFKRTDERTGYAAVVATDSWPKPGRPPRTWMERGTRKGVKLRKGIGGFRKASTAMRAIDFTPYMADKIEKALN